MGIYFNCKPGHPGRVGEDWPFLYECHGGLE